MTIPTTPGSRPALHRSSARAGSLPRKRRRSTPGGACSKRWAEARETVLVFEDLHWGDEALLVLPRAPRRLVGGRAASPAVYRPPGAVRAAPRVRREREKHAADQPAPSDRRGDSPPRREPPRAGRPARRGPTGAARARRRKPALRRGVRAPAHGPRRTGGGRGGAGLGAGADRRPPRHPEPGPQEPAPGRGRAGQGLLGRRARRDGRARAGEVEQALHELSRKELVRPARTSSMEGEHEYGFWHVLVRDVCYGQIPRAARAAATRRQPPGSSGKAGERVEDLADVLAHHYLTALELARAAGQSEKTQELQTAAIRYLVLAGERALPLDVERAEAHLARALELAPADDPRRADCSSAGRRPRSNREGSRTPGRRSRRPSPSTASRASLLAAGRVLTRLRSCSPGLATRERGAARRGARAARGATARPGAR